MRIAESLTDLLTELYRSMPSAYAHLKKNELSNGTEKHIIGFCGKLYPVWELNYYPNIRPVYGEYNGVTDFAYSSEDISHFLGKYKSLKLVAIKFLRHVKSENFYWQSPKFRKVNVDTIIKEFTNNSKLKEFFWEYRTPSFVIKDDGYGKGWKIVTNPNLAKYKFYKVKDTVTAYQDINQYLSGILGLNDKEIVHISDKDMKSQKGFYEYSFKTLPTKKR